MKEGSNNGKYFAWWGLYVDEFFSDVAEEEGDLCWWDEMMRWY